MLACLVSSSLGQSVFEESEATIHEADSFIEKQEGGQLSNNCTCTKENDSISRYILVADDGKKIKVTAISLPTGVELTAPIVSDAILKTDSNAEESVTTERPEVENTAIEADSEKSAVPEPEAEPSEKEETGKKVKADQKKLNKVEMKQQKKDAKRFKRDTKKGSKKEAKTKPQEKKTKTKSRK